jgi:hypothetical protein
MNHNNQPSPPVSEDEVQGFGGKAGGVVGSRAGLLSTGLPASCPTVLPRPAFEPGKASPGLFAPE